MVYKVLFSLLFLVTFFLRFEGLDYSHFYGDEIKTFYMDKTVPATEFFLEQRKGPLQFIVVWAMEKIIGGYDEFWTRLPFAILGTASVFVFYFVVLKLFENHKYKKEIGILASFIFSLSGFFIAFSRTIQYQSLLTFFGFIGIYFFLSRRQVLSGIFLGLAFLSHYDAIFFILPIFLISLVEKIRITKFITTFILLISIFYIPFLFNQNFTEDTLPYLMGRIEGEKYLPNSSLHTTFVYNPNYLYFVLLSFGVFKFAHNFKNYKNPTSEQMFLSLWIFFPFILFEIVFSNPGTHILNYQIPLIILASWGIVDLISRFPNLHKVSITILSLILVIILSTQIQIFTPLLNTGYPWNSDIEKDKYHLFLYGFPYNRNWEDIKQFLTTQKNYRTFYTNDNLVTAEYYLYPKPESFDNPDYFIDIKFNQLFKTEIINNEKNNYLKVYEIKKGNEVVAEIYKKQ